MENICIFCNLCTLWKLIQFVSMHYNECTNDKLSYHNIIHHLKDFVLAADKQEIIRRFVTVFWFNCKFVSFVICLDKGDNFLQDFWDILFNNKLCFNYT